MKGIQTEGTKHMAITTTSRITSDIMETSRGTTPTSRRTWRDVLELWETASRASGIDSALPRFPELCAKIATRQVMGDRGVLIMGVPGCGKTKRLQFISKHMDIKYVTASELTENALIFRDEESFREVIRVANENCVNNRRRNDLCIDDIGSEEPETVRYGQRSDVMRRVIEARYRGYCENGWMTHMTTNLTPDGLRERYGERIWSRLNEMCVMVSMTNADRRLSR